MRDIKINLNEAGPKTFEIVGSAFKIIEATTPDTTVRIGPSDESGRELPYRLDEGWKRRSFRGLRVEYDTQDASVTIRVWGSGDQFDGTPEAITGYRTARLDNQQVGPVTVAITDTYTDLLTVYPATGQAYGTISVTSAGPDAVKAFRVLRQAFAGGPWIEYVAEVDGTPADFSSGGNEAIRTSSIPGVYEIASGESADFDMNAFAAYALKFQAKCDTGNTATLTIGGTFTKG